jgi:hypothetical protein
MHLKTDGPTSDLREPGFPIAVRIAFPAVVIGLAVVRHVRPVGDPDAFWHIATGDWLWDTWQFSGPDPFSDASSNEWVLHEWLPQLVMSRVHEWWGLAGIAWAMCAMVAVLGLTLWYVCRMRSSLLVTGFVVGATFTGMSSSISPRPQMVTFVLTVVTVHAWLSSSEDGRARWWLPVLTWVWACSHGMWFIGPVIGFVVLVGALADRNLSRQELRRLTAVWLSCLVAGALTPAGPGLLFAPLRVAGYTQFVREWEPAALTDVALAAVIGLAGITVACWARGALRVPWVHVALVALSVGLALMYIRTVAVGAAVLAPVTAMTLNQALQYRREPLTAREASAVGAGAVGGLVVAALAIVNLNSPVAWGPRSLETPLRSLPAPTTVCNDYDIGAWLILNFPNVRPVIDGRTEVYSVDHVVRSFAFTQGFPGWNDYPDDLSCDIVLIREGAPTVELLAMSREWSETATGDGFTMLERVSITAPEPDRPRPLEQGPSAAPAREQTGHPGPPALPPVTDAPGLPVATNAASEAPHLESDASDHHRHRLSALFDTAIKAPSVEGLSNT